MAVFSLMPGDDYFLSRRVFRRILENALTAAQQDPDVEYALNVAIANDILAADFLSPTLFPRVVHALTTAVEQDLEHFDIEAYDASDEDRLYLEAIAGLFARLKNIRLVTAFEVPSRQRLAAELGISPVLVDESWERLTFTQADDVLELSYHVTRRHVVLHWQQADTIVLDMQREGAIRMNVETDGTGTKVVVSFDLRGARSLLGIYIAPNFHVQDRTELA